MIRVLSLNLQHGLPGAGAGDGSASTGSLAGADISDPATARTVMRATAEQIAELAPDIIVADEPTSALDVSVRAQVLNLLQDLKASLGLGLVFISHDINTVRYVSDRIAVMYFGKILELNTTEEIFNNPQEEYTRTLLSAVPSLLDV